MRQHRGGIWICWSWCTLIKTCSRSGMGARNPFLLKSRRACEIELLKFTPNEASLVGNSTFAAKRGSLNKVLHLTLLIHWGMVELVRFTLNQTRELVRETCRLLKPGYQDSLSTMRGSSEGDSGVCWSRHMNCPNSLPIWKMLIRIACKTYTNSEMEIQYY